MNNFLRNQIGQSTIEASVMGMALVTFVCLFLFSLYLIYSAFWSEHILYEALICYQERQSKSFCIGEAQNKVRHIMMLTDGFQIQIKESGSFIFGKLQFSIDPIVTKPRTFTFDKNVRF